MPRFILPVIAIAIATLSIFACGCSQTNANNTSVPTVSQKTDKASADLPEIYEDASYDDVVKFLEHGTGVLYFAMPTCPACTEYTPMLAKTASECGVEKIVFYDITDVRQEGGERYAKLIELAKEVVGYDADGKEKIFVPTLICLDAGKITFFDDETSRLTPSDIPASQYWDDRAVMAWKDKVMPHLEEAGKAAEACSSC